MLVAEPMCVRPGRSARSCCAKFPKRNRVSGWSLFAGCARLRPRAKISRRLTEAAGVSSTHIHEIPSQVRKLIDEGKAAAKREQKLLEEIASLTADTMLASLGEAKVVRAFYPDRDLAFIKLLAQRLTRQGNGGCASRLRWRAACRRIRPNLRPAK